MSDEAAKETLETEPDTPAKKRKKKKRKAESEGAALPAGFPEFAAAFPRDDALDPLVLAFEQGNYARVREGVAKLLAEDPPRPDDVRSAARELRRRIEPDPIAAYLLIGACLLLAFLAVWYFTHTGAAG